MRNLLVGVRWSERSRPWRWLPDTGSRVHIARHRLANANSSERKITKDIALPVCEGDSHFSEDLQA
jgi:hypothetical protein